MAGWWDSESVDELIYRIIGALPGKKMKLTAPVQYKLTGIQLFNLQSKQRAFIVGERHYDLGICSFKTCWIGE